MKKSLLVLVLMLVVGLAVIGVGWTSLGGVGARTTSINFHSWFTQYVTCSNPDILPIGPGFPQYPQ